MTSNEYCVEPTNKGSIYTVEKWNITISTGKDVTLLYTQCWDYGTFELTTNDNEIEELLQSSHIIINNHSGCMNTLEMGWYFSDEIKDKDSYTETELNEINRLIYKNDDEEEGIDTGILEDNGWVLEDTIYEVYDGINLR